MDKLSAAVTVWVSGLVVLCGQLALSAAAPEDMIAIQETVSACVTSRTLTLTCPSGHVAVLKSAKYFRSLEAGCGTQSTQLCEQEDVRAEWFWRCFLSKNSCDIALRLSAQSRLCDGYQGGPFLRVTYRCEIFIADAITTNTRDICAESGVDWEGALLYVHSPSWPQPGSGPLDCGCSVSVAPNLQLEINLSNFVSGDNRTQDCDQEFRIQSAGAERQICSEHHVRDFQPLDMEYDSDVYFKFSNLAPNESVKFLLVVQVHHEERVRVRCSRDYVMPALTSQAPPKATVTPKVLSVAAESSHSPRFPWPIIAGAVGTLCLTAIVGVIALHFCRKRRSRKNSNASKDLAFENHLCMECGPPETGKPNQNEAITITMSDVTRKAPPTTQVASSDGRAGGKDSSLNASSCGVGARPKTPSVKTNFHQIGKALPKEQLAAQAEASHPSATDTRSKVVAPSVTKGNKHPSLWQQSGRALAELKQAYPDIPEAVLRELRAQSEATLPVAHPVRIHTGNHSQNTGSHSANTGNNLSQPGSHSSNTGNASQPAKKACLPRPTEYLTPDPFSRDNPTHSSLTAARVSVKDRARLLNSSGSFSSTSGASQNEASDAYVTPYSSMGELSTKDKAKLMAQQLKAATRK